MNNEIIVIFGGTGYLGRTLSLKLLSLGCRIIVADINDQSFDSRIEFNKVDIKNYEDVKRIIPDGAIVINYAGIADLNKAKEMPRECIDINIIGHCNILKASIEKNVKKCCYASSAYVYSLYGGFYRISKRTCEEYMVEFGNKYGLNYLILRYGSIYGGNSNESNGMHRLVNDAITKSALYYEGFPTDSREFIHVSDASEITANLLLGKESNSAYLLTGSERYTMAELFAMLSEILNKHIDISYGENEHSDHYKMTQYNFVPIQARRISNNIHIDIGNGLMDLINTQHIILEKEKEK